jgi:hypothetical protein
VFGKSSDRKSRVFQSDYPATSVVVRARKTGNEPAPVEQRMARILDNSALTSAGCTGTDVRRRLRRFSWRGMPNVD